jgi:MoxR-like ATPase
MEIVTVPASSEQPAASFSSPGAVAEALGRTGYLADEALATVTFLATRLGRPILLEGEPGTGKTALAEALAQALGEDLIRLQCYEGIDATQALYDWDFPRQILHLRAVEALARDERRDAIALEAELFDERFLLARPVLRALREAPCVLLIDEIDRADDEFEAFLLEVLSTWQVTVPEVGTITAATPPVVVLTSNRTRELHDALKRRCLYHWIDYPSFEREVEIVRRRVPGTSDDLARDVVGALSRLRAADVQKPPGVAEGIDWLAALELLGAGRLDAAAADRTLGAVLKYREDQDAVRAAGLDAVVARG